jgi:uncharacterized protein (DUF4415 family)
MSGKNIRRYSLEEIRAMKGQTDWKALTNEGDYEGPHDEESDFEVDWTRAVLVEGIQKTPISLRLDPDVLAFFKTGGPGYQTRINAVLRAYMEAQKPRKHG